MISMFTHQTFCCIVNLCFLDIGMKSFHLYLCTCTMPYKRFVLTVNNQSFNQSCLTYHSQYPIYNYTTGNEDRGSLLMATATYGAALQEFKPECNTITAYNYT